MSRSALPLALIAVGGNSLIRAGEKGTIAEQLANVRRTAQAVVAIARAGHHVVVTHGNGPQVGAALLRSERTAGQVYGMPLDVCVAATQGEIGYLLQQALADEVASAGLDLPVVTVVTQVVVADDDPAMRHPTKPVGPFYSRTEAAQRQARDRWIMVEDAARGWRRVVPSPEPLEVVEEPAIRHLLDAGALVVAAGGGGVPVVRDRGVLRGVEAVIDKDRASALLATRLGARLLAISTDAEHVCLDYRKPSQQSLRRVTAAELRAHHAAGQFPPGNMGPKIEAALRFLDGGGREVVITTPERLAAAVAGDAGTHVVPDAPAPGPGGAPAAATEGPRP